MGEDRGPKNERTSRDAYLAWGGEEGESEERYRAIVEGQAEMVCRFRPDGTILFANGAYARARGTTPEALRGADFWNFVEEEDRPSVRAMLDRLRPESPEVRIENRFETAEGVRWTLWTNRGLSFDADGRAAEVQSSGIDITDRKQAEQALSDSEAKLSAIVERLPVGLGMVDAQGRTLSLNPAGLRLHGFASLDEMLVHLEQYREAFELRYPDGRLMPAGEWPLARALRGDYVHEYEVRLRRCPDGEEKVVSYSAVPIREERDGTSRVVFVMHDVTDRRRAEEAVQERKRQLELVIDTAPAFIAHCDRECRFRFVSRAYAERFGLTPADVIGRHVSEVLGQAPYEAVKPRIAEVLAGRTVEFETEVEYLKWGRRHMHARYAPEVDAQGEVIGFVAVVTDITDRKRAERDQALLAAIVASSQDAIVSKTLEGVITSWNAGAERIFGYTAEEAVGQPVVMLIPPERRDEEAYILGQIRCGKRVEPYETVRLTKDGRRLDLSITVSPLHDGTGRVIGASKVARDISAKKQAEQALRELNQTLERRVAERTADLEERNKELQAFAYIASHDLREPLRKIQTFASLMRQEEGETLGEEGRFFLERMQSAAARMDGLLFDLLSFSRVATDTNPVMLVRLDEVIADVLRDYELTIRETNAEVEVEAAVMLEADGSQMRQLLTNLIGNAFKYRREDVPPRVRISATVVEGDEAEQIVADGPGCRIVVEDNGIGFEEKYRERIFEPFQRLHGREAYEGTGMGLAICRRIVQRHGGTLSAESTPGAGSRFIVLLPVRRTECQAECQTE